MKLYWLSITAFGLLTNQIAYADDVEIYKAQGERIDPNILFIFDTSGSMVYSARGNQYASSVADTRIQAVKDAAKKAINQIAATTEDKHANISIMRFTNDANGSRNSTTAKGGYPVSPFMNTREAANITALESAISNLQAGGGTPLVESLHEGARFIRGDAVNYGKPFYDGTKRSGRNRYPYHVYIDSDLRLNYSRREAWGYGGAHSDTIQGSSSSYTYKSPMTDTCQENHIVLFSDGQPSADSDSDSAVRALLSGVGVPSGVAGITSNCKYESGKNSCGEELAYWLNNTDHFVDKDVDPDLDSSNTREKKQPIVLHTVGFNLAGYAKNLMGNMARASGTDPYFVDSSDTLAQALVDISTSIANKASSFTSPTLAVSTFNNLEHRDQVYYSLFEPSANPGWIGNLKRYKINAKGQIIDANDSVAVDPDTGAFKDTAKSFWTTSTAPDGASVSAGGMAKRLEARKVYSNLSGSSNAVIISSNNLVTETNTSITTSMLGVSSSDARTSVLRWARGIDDSGNETQFIGDPLHTNPTLVSYGSGSSVTDVLYMGTNAGYLHAFDTSQSAPKELWAFIPKRLLPNLTAYKTGVSDAEKTYGLDGPITLFHRDKNQNNSIDNGEKAYIAVGMRRGGSAYYLIDISNKSAPTLVASIDDTTSGFSELGQTWSKMELAYAKWNGKSVPVFFFGGGYDTGEDNKTTRSSSSKGNAIYMVAADTQATGKAFDLLWKASPSAGSGNLSLSGMTSSIASDVTPVDKTGDGNTDLIYASDVGGRIWRIDFVSDNAKNAKGGMIADFNGGSASDNIRFFTQPDVVYTNHGEVEYPDPTDSTKVIKKKEGRYQIAIGSGFRPGPLDTGTEDHIFVINDFNVTDEPSSYTTLSKSSLANYQNYGKEDASKRRNGFFYDLRSSGEKVLSSSLTVADTIYVTSFRPSEGGTKIGCEPDVGQARVIILRPELDDEGKPTVEETDLDQGGIPPEPTTYIPALDSGEPGRVIVNKQIVDTLNEEEQFKHLFWREL